MTHKISTQSQNTALRLPAVYADRMNVIIGQDGMARITFGQFTGPIEIEWHQAIAMTNANVEALYETIGVVLRSAAVEQQKVGVDTTKRMQ